ncbi:unnamed protein product, partial [Sphagnum compactum]
MEFEVAAVCGTARAARLTVGGRRVSTPVFMPVGTQGTMKGVTCGQLRSMGCEILLGNTYHLGHRPGPALLETQGGLHDWMDWDGAILTDSGGFQMVSLAALSSVDETGVEFTSPHDGKLRNGVIFLLYAESRMLLRPEDSMAIQRAIGSDIVMQLDDVVNPLSPEERLDVAAERSVRWLDRCIASLDTNKNRDCKDCEEPKSGVGRFSRKSLSPVLFAIVQGGLDVKRRAVCVEKMLERGCFGHAIGGLGGGENKTDFCSMVAQCAGLLGSAGPVYCMGIGYDEDVLVCVALGVDMFDCVFPTRTARFGHALHRKERDLALGRKQFAFDLRPISENCACVACSRGMSRAVLHSLVGRTDCSVGCHLLTLHNLEYMLSLMRDVRASIVDGSFPDF